MPRKKLLQTIALLNLFALGILKAELRQSMQIADEQRGGVRNYTKRKPNVSN